MSYLTLLQRFCRTIFLLLFVADIVFLTKYDDDDDDDDDVSSVER